MNFSSRHLRFQTWKSLPKYGAYLCDMRGDVPAEPNVASLASGLWWVYPLGWAIDDIIYGLRLMPGVPLAKSPVMVAQRSCANTIVSCAANFVPVKVFEEAFRDPARWRAFARARPKDWKPYLTLHHELGGVDELDELRTVLADQRLASKKHATSDFRERSKKALEIRARLDPTPETLAFTSYLAKVITDGVAQVPAPQAGCWNAAIASLVLAVADEGADSRTTKAWAARRLVTQLPGLDCHRSTALTLSADVAAANAVTAAKLVMKDKSEQAVDSRARPAIAKVAQAKRYDGAAHLELAKTLEATKAYAASFDALMTAAFWQAQRRREVDASILTRARKLARKAKWVDLADSLDEMHEVRAELIRDGDWQLE